MYVYTFRPPKIVLNYLAHAHARTIAHSSIRAFIYMYLHRLSSALSEFYTSTRHCLIVTFGNSAALASFQAPCLTRLRGAVLHATRRALRTLFPVNSIRMQTRNIYLNLRDVAREITFSIPTLLTTL